MGWAVGWDSEHRRHRGYGVPAYCDAYAKGCRAEIDRGLGYVCEATTCDREGEEGEDGLGCLDIDALDKHLFLCGEHTCADVDEDNLPPEHPEWVAHVLNDVSWSQWREENPAQVKELQTAGCECWMTPPETWLSAASCGYGSGYEPGSQWEWNPDCPVHVRDARASDAD